MSQKIHIKIDKKERDAWRSGFLTCLELVAQADKAKIEKIQESLAFGDEEK